MLHPAHDTRPCRPIIKEPPTLVQRSFQTASLSSFSYVPTLLTSSMAESALAMKASVSLRALGSRVPHFRLLKAFRFPLHLTFLQTTIHSLLLFVPHVKAFRFPHLTFLQKPPSAKNQTNLAPEFTLSRNGPSKQSSQEAQPSKHLLSRSICRCAGML